MTDTTAPTAQPTTDREFRHTRFLAATPAQVLAAIADPTRIARWWGPNGFSSTIETFEFKPDGIWKFVLHGPDGANYPNYNIFREVGAERVVVDHIDDAHHFILTITLDAHEHGTMVGWHQLFDTAEHCAEIAPFVGPANEQNLDRLERDVTQYL